MLKEGTSSLNKEKQKAIMLKDATLIWGLTKEEVKIQRWDINTIRL